MPFVRNLFFLFLTLFLKSLAAQTPLMYNYTTDDGLSGTEVFDVIQDDKGYVWIATNNGICKFNGTSFESYYTKDGLPDNSVIDFYKDDSGRIWIMTYTNEIAYLKDDRIIPYEYNDLLKRYDNYSGYCFQSFMVKDHDLYLGMFHDVIIKIDKSGHIDTIKQFEEVGMSVYIDDKDKIIYTQYNPSKINYQTKILKQDSTFFLDPFKEKNFNDYKVKYLYLKQVLFGAYGKKLIISASGQDVQELYFDSEITKLKHDRNGNILVGTYNSGLFMLSKSGDTYRVKYNVLKEKTVTSAFNDKDGGYWISTYNNGLYYIPSLEYMYFNQEHGLHTNHVTNLEYGNDKLWYTGINKYFGYIEDTIQNYDLSAYNLNNFSDLFYDKTKDRIWGVFDGGIHSLFYLDDRRLRIIKNSEIDRSLVESNPLHHTNTLHIKSIYSYSDTLFLGVSPGFYQVSEIDEHYLINNIDTAETVHKVARCNKNKMFWLGNRDGLFFKKGGKIQAYESFNPLFKKRIIKLICDTVSNLLMVATKDTGLYILKDDQVSLITEKQGLSSNNITAMAFKDNQLWVGTLDGLDQISFKTDDHLNLDIRHFNENKGLISNVINDIVLSDSIVYIATDKGISFFNYKKIKKNPSAPPLYLKRIQINKRDTSIHNHYVLSNKENVLSIEYECLNFSAHGNLKYKYKLEGFDELWNETEASKLEFLILQPGKYKLTIIAVNEDGMESPEPIQLSFRIKPPFYKSWWFIILNILAIIMLTLTFILAVYRVRIKEIKKRNRVEKQLTQERQKALAQQMNPHFIFNTLNSIQYYLFKNDKHASIDYLQKFAELIRNNLYNSQKDFISIQDEIKSLDTYLELELLRLSDKFEYSIHNEGISDPAKTKIPCFLIQPFVENAIWHGIQHLDHTGKLTIAFGLNDHHILCEIEDNGIGREKSLQINHKKNKSHQSLGSTITEKRIDLINRLYKKNLTIEYIDKKDESGNAKGTLVRLNIPFF